MPAAVYQGDHRLAVERRPLPDVGTDDVLLEVSHCGICGTDLHMVIEGWGHAGRPHLCIHRHKAGVTPFQGAFAAYKQVAAGQLFRIPDGLDLRTAALT